VPFSFVALKIEAKREKWRLIDKKRKDKLQKRK
jgi:hypothetical protein